MKIQKKIKNDSSSPFQNVNSIILLIKKHILLAIILFCIGFIGLVWTYSHFFSKPTFVYVKIQVGQGYWWASTQRPSIWFVNAIQQAKEQKDFSGTPLSKIVNVTYYPYYATNQYDIYVIARLKVTRRGKTGPYSFNRETIGVGTPIDLEFPNVQFSGAIMDISSKPITDSYIEKTVYLTKKSTQTWEFDAINVGDTFVNGKNIMFRILEKTKGDTYNGLITDLNQNVPEQAFPVDTQPYTPIMLKTKMLLRKDKDQLFFAEDLAISPGKSFGITLSSSVLNGYTVTKVE